MAGQAGEPGAEYSRLVEYPYREVWNYTAQARASRLFEAAQRAADRFVRRQWGGTLPRQIGNVRSEQKRGVWHFHWLLPMGTEVERVWSRCVRRYFEQAWRQEQERWSAEERWAMRNGHRGRRRAEDHVHEGRARPGARDRRPCCVDPYRGADSLGNPANTRASRFPAGSMASVSSTARPGGLRRRVGEPRGTWAVTRSSRRASDPRWASASCDVKSGSRVRARRFRRLSASASMGRAPPRATNSTIAAKSTHDACAVASGLFRLDAS